MINEPPARRPPRTVRVKSPEVRIRDRCGSTASPASVPGQTASCSRPLRRRAARTARPARVRIRSRKPWTFARRRLFGWNVRLLTGAPDTVQKIVREDVSHQMAQPVNGRGDRPAGQTRLVPSALDLLSVGSTIVEHRDFHNASAAGDLGCGKSTSAGRPPRASCRHGMGKPTVQRTYTPCGRTCGQRVAVWCSRLGQDDARGALGG